MARMDDIENRVEDLENTQEAIGSLPSEVAALKGMVEVLQTLVLAQSQKVSEATGWKTAVQFAAAVIVPLLVSLIGGYFVLKAAGIHVAEGTK